MRGLIACIVIANLALANCEYYEKWYEYTNKDVVHSDPPFVNEKLVYGVCEYGPEKKCIIYQESIQAERSSVKSCDLNLQFTGDYSSTVTLQHNGKDNVILTVKDGSKIRLVTLNMISCIVKKRSIKPDVDTSIAIIPKDYSYEVVFENSKLCKDFVCKASYDYDGNIVKKATAFGIKATNSSFIIKASDQGFLVGEFADTYTKVHFLRDGDYDSKILFYTPGWASREYFIPSTNKNKLSYCIYVNGRFGETLINKVVCHQFDAEGNMKRAIEHPITVYFSQLDIVGALNLDDGFLALWIESSQRGSGQPPAIIYKYDEDLTKLAKFTTDTFQCNRGYHAVPNLYINSSGDYCAAVVCQSNFNRLWERDSIFSTVIKCFQESQMRITY